jgi:hypothetical protein
MHFKHKSGLSMNLDSQTRMTNDEILRNTEIRMTNGPLHTRGLLDLRASDFFRHLSFVIRPGGFRKLQNFHAKCVSFTQVSGIGPGSQAGWGSKIPGIGIAKLIETPGSRIDP